jgi:hypothetical protein
LDFIFLQMTRVFNQNGGFAIFLRAGGGPDSCMAAGVVHPEGHHPTDLLKDILSDRFPIPKRQAGVGKENVQGKPDG